MHNPYQINGIFSESNLSLDELNLHLLLKGINSDQALCELYDKIEQSLQFGCE